MILNFEFKAKADDIYRLEQKLQTLDPTFIGEDGQTDTYFNVEKGRLKLREGNIENALIFYERENTADAKASNILLYQHQPDEALKEILKTTLGVKVVVKKQRKIYFVDNVKFHFDTVEALGTFIEVEAIDRTGDIGKEKLQAQCLEYATFFDIQESNYVALSYSDLLLEKTSKNHI